MIVKLNNKNLFYETEKIIRLFLPFEKILFNKEINDDRALFIEINNIICVKLLLNGKEQTYTINFESNLEVNLLKAVFLCFVNLCGYKPDWGILTGIRPTRLWLSFVEKLSEEETYRIFKEDYLLNDKKINLLNQTAKNEQEIISLSKANSASLYVSIPFCPSKCAYCSFVSDATDKAAKLKPIYVEKLIEELKEISLYSKNLNLNIETVYIGGGTPSTLSPEELDLLLSSIYKFFDLKNLREFTVEAGRADSINKEKLKAIYPYADRICINPQTLNNNVLAACKRNHTKEEFIKVFLKAKEMGFKNINCDLIAGLPEDTEQSFENSIKELISLDPEGITVHTLSLKRAANLYKNAYYEFEEGKTVSNMTNKAYDMLKLAGYIPYYLYRQSKTIGNLENIGYSKPKYKGYYNVYIMDETHTILGAGAGAVTKLKNQKTNRIERIFNYKFPFEYISQFDEMLRRKQKIGEFYSDKG